MAVDCITLQYSGPVKSSPELNETRSLSNLLGEAVEEAGPSSPVKGLEGGTSAGNRQIHGNGSATELALVFRVPEVGRGRGNFVRRIADFGREAIHRRIGLFDSLGVHLLKFLESFLAEKLPHGRIVVETS
jgi:hypothetical protein